ncbi:hypothetical protein RHSIM_RhsimUnG0010600 [Rhododendron simsii]|uniref:Uncharacterized protein n=1 Tax=Rhododendron simsii TaxID=118357 RepID=A0A834G027_RHOSS|nr:hypothetical protein RHSIM_RhsimUnG0010600 [Rhododendron simsii]
MARCDARLQGGGFEGFARVTGEWKDKVLLALGCMDLDLTIREDEPPKPTNDSSIATHISSSIRNSIPPCDKVKDYMKAIEEQFVSSDKALASTLMNRIVEARNAKFIEDIDISGSKSQRIEWEQSPDSITAPKNEEKLVVIQDNQQDILHEQEKKMEKLQLIKQSQSTQILQLKILQM